MIEYQKWVYAMLENVLKPLVRDIHKILKDTLKLKIEKRDLFHLVDKTYDHMKWSLIVNSILYLFIALLVCLTLWRVYA